MQTTEASTSDGNTFRLLGEYLSAQLDPQSDRLVAVLAVASSFENLHRELLYRFEQVLASPVHHRPVALKGVQLTAGDESIAHLGDALNTALAQHRALLPHSVAEAVNAFSLAVAPAVRAKNDEELVRGLVRHHERVQAGKLDASRQPKHPWVELNGTNLVVAPRYALDEWPDEPSSTEFTHPYRIEQFADMLKEAGAWAVAS